MIIVFTPQRSLLSSLAILEPLIIQRYIRLLILH